MLRMRRLLAAILCLSVGFAFAGQSTQQNSKTEKTGQTNAAEIRGTQKEPLVVEVLPPSDAEKKAAHEREDRKEKLDVDLVKFTEKLAEYTKDLSTFTFILIVVGVSQLLVFGYQGWQLRKTVDVAVMEAKPLLFPFITDMGRLHPLSEAGDATVTHDANIFIGFDNYGKTPAIIREVRAKLFLTIRDRLPKVDVEKLTLHRYNVWVAGDSRGIDLKTGTLDLKQVIKLTPLKLRELISSADGRYRRFALIGKVVYDDLFGGRHSTIFCVKMRLWLAAVEVAGKTVLMPHVFQVGQGGRRYNGTKSEEIPNPDRLNET